MPLIAVPALHSIPGIQVIMSVFWSSLLPVITIYCQVGDRVFTVQTVSGSYAEYCLAKEGHTFKLHPDLTFSQGAALGVPYFTAYRALFLGLAYIICL